MRWFTSMARTAGKVFVAAALATSCLAPIPVYAATSPDKTETVHVQTDATGAVSEVTVEVLLANGAKAKTVPDRTNLTDIKPSDNKTFTDTGDGSLMWDADGKQVSYKGTSNSTLPVEVKLSYQLDGVEVTPSELAGATGHLKLRVDYRNTSSSQRDIAGKTRTLYTPFVCVTLVTLDGEVARNVTVTNGSVMEDKGGCAVVGYAMPGLKESLDLDIDELDLDLPTYVEIEADVTDFELDSIYTMVTAELFEDLDASDLKDRDTDEGADALRDAMSQLIDGSSSLTDALNQIAQGGGALSTGADALREALGMLPGGLAELKAGAQTLSDRLGEASGVTESLAQASSGIAAAATQASQGLGAASGSIAQAEQSVSDLSELSGLMSLSDIGLEQNSVEDISPLKKLRKLRRLDLYANDVSDISALAELTNLEILDVRNNNVHSIEILRNHTKMRELYISMNRISDISPVENMTDLTYLSMGYNQIEDISALYNLTRLTGLTMSGNRIKDISVLNRLNSLSHLEIEDNPIEDYSPLNSFSDSVDIIRD